MSLVRRQTDVNAGCGAVAVVHDKNVPRRSLLHLAEVRGGTKQREQLPPREADTTARHAPESTIDLDNEALPEERMESNDVLGVIAPGLASLGFTVEQRTTRDRKLPRPVFFGDEGAFLRTYEIDAFEPEKQCVRTQIEHQRARPRRQPCVHGASF
jgi:hypothetical protein